MGSIRDRAERDREEECESDEGAAWAPHPRIIREMARRSRDRIVVIGAGIVGASIAYHLAKRGAEVTVVDRTGPAAEATGRSFAWINATFGNPQPYFSLRFQSLLEWRVLEAELDGGVVNWGGSLLWLGPARDPHLPGLVRTHQRWGYPVRLIDRDEMDRVEPALGPTPLRAAYAACEGSVDPRRATEALLDRVQKHGARTEYACSVIGLRASGTTLEVATTRETFEAETVVVAAGVSTPDIVQPLGVSIPLVRSPSVLAYTAPVAPILRTLVLGPDCHVKQEPDGRVVAGPGSSVRTSRDDSRAAGERILAAAQALVPELPADLDSVTLGWRPMPRDAQPIVGPCPGVPGLYVAVTHSGVTLAPTLGRLAATEILEDVEVDALGPYRPARFL